MGNQVDMKPAPTVRTDTMAIDSLAQFLEGLYVSAHSNFVQMEQFKKWLGRTLTDHPSLVMPMVGSESVRRFINSIQQVKECPKCHAKLE